MADFDPQDPSTYGGNIPGQAQVTAPTPVMPGTAEMRTNALREIAPPSLAPTGHDRIREAIGYLGAGLRQISGTPGTEQEVAKYGAEEQGFQDQQMGRVAYGYMSRLNSIVTDNPQMAPLVSKAMREFLFQGADRIPLPVQQLGAKFQEKLEQLHQDENLRQVLINLPPGGGPQLEAAQRMARMYSPEHVSPAVILGIAKMYSPKDLPPMVQTPDGKFVEFTRGPDGQTVGREIQVPGFTPTGKFAAKFAGLDKFTQKAIINQQGQIGALTPHDLMAKFEQGDPNAQKQMIQAQMDGENLKGAAEERVEQRKVDMQTAAEKRKADLIPGPMRRDMQAAGVQNPPETYTDALSRPDAFDVVEKHKIQQLALKDRADAIGKGKLFAFDKAGNMQEPSGTNETELATNPNYVTVSEKTRDKIIAMQRLGARLNRFSARVAEAYTGVGSRNPNATLKQAWDLYFGAALGKDQAARFWEAETKDLGVQAAIAFAPSARMGQYMSEAHRPMLPEYRDAPALALRKMQWMTGMAREGILAELGQRPNFNLTPESVAQEFPEMRMLLGATKTAAPKVKGPVNVGGGVTWEDR